METAETILSALSQPVLVVDGALRPLIANPAFCEMLGLDAKRASRRVIDGFVSGDGCRPPLREILASFSGSAGDAVEGETLCTLRTGGQIILRINARKMHAAGLEGMVLVEPRDITGERGAENLIQEMNEALQEHAASVEAANIELDAFSHSVSHDLRAPLRFVNRLAHLLLSAPGVRLSPDAVRQVGLIVRATDEMGRLIGDLLLFSQMQTVPLANRRVEIGELFREAAEKLQGAQEGRGVEVVVGEMPPCRGDRALLREVAANLLANAFKFTRGRAEARITVGCAASEEEEEAVYFVRDNGAGFDMDRANSLFVPFQRLHRQDEFEGTGVGLALVKRIIERHNGRIWAEAAVDRGATFYFTVGEGKAPLKEASP